MVLRVIIADELEGDEFRSGVVSTGVTGNSRTSGLGFKILITARRNGQAFGKNDELLFILGKMSARKAARTPATRLSQYPSCRLMRRMAKNMQDSLQSRNST